jgi:hypothetical protein
VFGFLRKNKQTRCGQGQSNMPSGEFMLRLRITSSIHRLTTGRACVLDENRFRLREVVFENTLSSNGQAKSEICLARKSFLDVIHVSIYVSALVDMRHWLHTELCRIKVHNNSLRCQDRKGTCGSKHPAIHHENGKSNRDVDVSCVLLGSNVISISSKRPLSLRSFSC